MNPCAPANHRRRLLGLALAGGWFALGGRAWAAKAASASYVSRPEVQDFAGDTADRFGLEMAWVQSALASGRHCEAAARWMAAPSSPSQDWHRFRQGQIDAHKLARGLSFWWKYQDALQQAQIRFGIDPEIVVAIIGIESGYGRVTGRFRTLDVLLTLAFDLPRRAGEYREELAQLLMLSHEQGTDPTRYLGSIAGAIGMPQFLPSSIRRYALDFDEDGQIDLAHSARDAIGSVAHFLSGHGWRAGLPVMVMADLPDALIAAQASAGSTDSQTSWGQLQQLGARSDRELEAAEPVRLIGLRFIDERGRPGQDLRAGTSNFEALLGYNRSFFYAATVAELARELRRRYDADPPSDYSASG